MKDIVTVINEVNKELEIKVNEYIFESHIINMPFQPPIYLPEGNDFSIYYTKQKPFQRVIGTVNLIKQK